jgi:hypothetical protein
MTLQKSQSWYPEPATNPPCADVGLVEIREQIEELDTAKEQTADALECWADFNISLSGLDIPENVRALLETINPEIENWLRGKMQKEIEELAELLEREEEWGFPWK